MKTLLVAAALLFSVGAQAEEIGWVGKSERGAIYLTFDSCPYDQHAKFQALILLDNQEVVKGCWKFNELMKSFVIDLPRGSLAVPRSAMKMSWGQS
jgi:hypothetical protein